MTKFKMYTSRRLDRLVEHWSTLELEKLVDYWIHPDHSDFDDTNEAWQDGWNNCLEMMGEYIDKLRKNPRLKLWCLSTSYVDDGFEFYVFAESVAQVIERISKIKISNEVQQMIDEAEREFALRKERHHKLAAIYGAKK